MIIMNNLFLFKTQVSTLKCLSLVNLQHRQFQDASGIFFVRYCLNNLTIRCMAKGGKGSDLKFQLTDKAPTLESIIRALIFIYPTSTLSCLICRSNFSHELHFAVYLMMIDGDGYAIIFPFPSPSTVFRSRVVCFRH